MRQDEKKCGKIRAFDGRPHRGIILLYHIRNRCRPQALSPNMSPCQTPAPDACDVNMEVEGSAWHPSPLVAMYRWRRMPTCPRPFANGSGSHHTSPSRHFSQSRHISNPPRALAARVASKHPRAPPGGKSWKNRVIRCQPWEAGVPGVRGHLGRCLRSEPLSMRFNVLGRAWLGSFVLRLLS